MGDWDRAPNRSVPHPLLRNLLAAVSEGWPVLLLMVSISSRNRGH